MKPILSQSTDMTLLWKQRIKRKEKKKRKEICFLLLLLLPFISNGHFGSQRIERKETIVFEHGYK